MRRLFLTCCGLVSPWKRFKRNRGATPRSPRNSRKTGGRKQKKMVSKKLMILAESLGSTKSWKVHVDDDWEFCQEKKRHFSICVFSISLFTKEKDGLQWLTLIHWGSAFKNIHPEERFFFFNLFSLNAGFVSLQCRTTGEFARFQWIPSPKLRVSKRLVTLSEKLRGNMAAVEGAFGTAGISTRAAAGDGQSITTCRPTAHQFHSFACDKCSQSEPSLLALTCAHLGNVITGYGGKTRNEQSIFGRG